MNFGGISLGHGVLVRQATYLFGGLFLLLIGNALLFTLLYWRTRTLFDPNLFPRVEIAASDGSMIRFLDHAGSNPAPYKVGDRVAVLYKADNPKSTAMIDRGARNWTPVGMLLLLGGTFATLGFFSLRRT